MEKYASYFYSGEYNVINFDLKGLDWSSFKSEVITALDWLTGFFNCVFIGLDSTISKAFEFQTAYPIVLKFSTLLPRVQERPPVELYHPPPSSLEATLVRSSKVPFSCSRPKVSVLVQRLQTVIARLVVISLCSSLDSMSS